MRPAKMNCSCFAAAYDRQRSKHSVRAWCHDIHPMAAHRKRLPQSKDVTSYAAVAIEPVGAHLRNTKYVTHRALSRPGSRNWCARI